MASMVSQGGSSQLGRIMTKEKLVEIIQGLLKTDIDLAFLTQLKKRELETLVACIRDRVQHSKN